MKLFGSGKGRSDKRNMTSGRTTPQRESSKGASQQESLKAFLMLICSLFVLSAVLVMCISLINKSAGSTQLSFMPKTNELKYEVNTAPPTTPAEDPLVNFAAPESLYDASMLNILIGFGDDSAESMDAIMLANFDLESKEMALLSIPRDTYISGNYELPKVSQVYHEAEGGERGAEALTEKVKEMIGFWPDYYLIFDEDALALLVEQAGGIVSFDMGVSPDYSELSNGTKTITSDNVMKVFQYRSDYTDVETEPARKQRLFFQTLLDQLVRSSEDLTADAAALHELVGTDLSVSDLTYLTHFLKDVDLMSAFSRALPGGEIDVEDILYYEVNVEDAVAMLNEIFNPLEDALTIYDVNFRQKTGASGEGEFSDYGFPTEESTKDPDENDSEDTDGESEESTSPDVETEAPTEPPTEAPTDPPAEDPTQTP